MQADKGPEVGWSDYRHALHAGQPLGGAANGHGSPGLDTTLPLSTGFPSIGWASVCFLPVGSLPARRPHLLTVLPPGVPDARGHEPTSESRDVGCCLPDALSGGVASQVDVKIFTKSSRPRLISSQLPHVECVTLLANPKPPYQCDSEGPWARLTSPGVNS